MSEEKRVDIKISSGEDEDPEDDDQLTNVYSSDEYKQFISELIETYKAHPILWDKSHPDYRKAELKEEHYLTVYRKYLEYYPDRTLEQMKQRLENLRTCFRRHYAKEQEAKKNNEYYKPNMFYYDLLYFLCGDDEYKSTENVNSPEYRHFILDFIDCYKEHPILWDKDHPDYWRPPKCAEKEPAYHNLFVKYLEYFPDATGEMMRGKIDNLRGAVFKQYKKVVEARKRNEDFKPPLFYYNAMYFIVQEDLQNCQDYRKFMIEFISALKKFPALWDKKDPDFSNKSSGRTEAYNALFQKYLEYYPTATIHQMKEKLENIKTVFRREWNKVQAAKKANQDCKPKLFYYNLLLFMVDEEAPEGANEIDAEIGSGGIEESSQKFYLCWTKDDTASLMGLMKKYPATYSGNDKKKRLEAFNALTMDLMAECDKKFKTEEVIRKVKNLKEMYRRYYRNGCKRDVNSWLYDQMKGFMSVPSEKGNTTANLRSKRRETCTNNEQDSGYNFRNNKEKEAKDKLEDDLDTNSSDFDDSVEMKNIELQDNTQDRDGETMETIDEAPTEDVKEEDEKLDSEMAQLRVTLATKLRDMPEDQRQYAEQLISEVMYSGLMEKLTSNSNLSF